GGRQPPGTSQVHPAAFPPQGGAASSLAAVRRCGVTGPRSPSPKNRPSRVTRLGSRRAFARRAAVVASSPSLYSRIHDPTPKRGNEREQAHGRVAEGHLGHVVEVA